MPPENVSAASLPGPATANAGQVPTSIPTVFLNSDIVNGGGTGGGGGGGGGGGNAGGGGSVPTAQLSFPKLEKLTQLGAGYRLARLFAVILLSYSFSVLIWAWSSEARFHDQIAGLLTKLSPEAMRQVLAPSATPAENQSTNGGKVTTTEATDPAANAAIMARSEAVSQGVIKPVSDAFQESRSSILEFHKTVIVNVILPILTALLGYIFAKPNDEQS